MKNKALPALKITAASSPRYKSIRGAEDVELHGNVIFCPSFCFWVARGKGVAQTSGVRGKNAECEIPECYQAVGSCIQLDFMDSSHK